MTKGRTLANMQASAKRPTKISLDSTLVEEACALDINISQVCEQGLLQRIAESKADRWLTESREAIASSNVWVEGKGLPLGPHRQF